MACVGTGNPSLLRTSLRFLWISLTFHSQPDLCFHTDFCMRALSHSPLRCCGSTPAKIAGRASASVCSELEPSLQGHILRCPSPEELGFCRQRGGERAHVLRCWARCRAGLCQPTRGSQSPMGDPHWSMRDGEAAGKALERLI